MTTAREPLTIPPGASPRAATIARRILSPIEAFLHVEASSGIVLIVATAIALFLANGPLEEAYRHTLHAPLGVRLGGLVFERPVHFWIDDALMTLFFFVVGLEIRREMHGGELANLRRAALPVAAAVGGMVAPALIYLAVNGSHTETRSGWGVPMATDIAFAVGVLALLGKRVPPALRVLLLALAIIDDIGSILVIALFYSGAIDVGGLAIAGAGILGVIALKKVGVRHSSIYVVPGFFVWLGVMRSGVHPTIAGVILGLLTPAAAEPGHDAPAKRLQEALHPWVAFGIMPVFAVANAGVRVAGAGLTHVSLGIILGLVLGKPIGILAACKLGKHAGFVTPRGIGTRELVVLGCVAGIGFTMALFVGALAFDPGPRLDEAKTAILIASGLAMVVGLGAGFALLGRSPREEDCAATEAEAEASDVV